MMNWWRGAAARKHVHTGFKLLHNPIVAQQNSNLFENRQTVAQPDCCATKFKPVWKSPNCCANWLLRNKIQTCLKIAKLLRKLIVAQQNSNLFENRQTVAQTDCCATKFKPVWKSPNCCTIWLLRNIIHTCLKIAKLLYKQSNHTTHDQIVCATACVVRTVWPLLGPLRRRLWNGCQRPCESRSGAAERIVSSRVLRCSKIAWCRSFEIKL